MKYIKDYSKERRRGMAWLRDRHKVPSNFKPKVAYIISENITRIALKEPLTKWDKETYKSFEGKIFKDGIKPTAFNVWCLWKFGEIPINFG